MTTTDRYSRYTVSAVRDSRMAANANPTLPAYKCVSCNGTGKATR